jgi:hypothetical protein
LLMRLIKPSPVWRMVSDMIRKVPIDAPAYD